MNETGDSPLSADGMPDLPEMTVEALIEEVPADFRERFTAIVELTDPFCDEHLDDEYKMLCRGMAMSICQKGSPVRSGKPTSWAGGIIHTLGQINFLTDPGQTPHMTTAQLAERIGVSASTLSSKAKVIRDGLGIIMFDPSWCLPSKLENNPFMMAAGMMEESLGHPVTPEQLMQMIGESGLFTDDADEPSGMPGLYDDDDDDDDDLRGRGVVGKIGF